MSQNVEMVSNFQQKKFGLNVRRNGPQPSVFVRTFSPITTWSPNGKCIACSVFEEVKGKNGTTSLFGNKIHIWDVTSGQVLFIYEGHSDTVVAIVWSPDGKYIASSSSSGVIHIWQAIRSPNDAVVTTRKVSPERSTTSNPSMPTLD